MERLLLPLLALVAATSAQETYKLCAPDSIDQATCNAIQRGESRVSCVRVSDSTECAIRMSRSEVDFGIFSADEALLVYQFYQTEIQPIFERKHRDRLEEDFEYQSVAVIPTTLDPFTIGKGFEGIRNVGFCHPGFSETQWWNDYVLKYFEKKVYTPKCRSNLTAAENEAENLKKFFGTACRPGEWVADSSFDSYLKKKYPELCALCDDKAGCKYTNKDNHGHTGALKCLSTNRGKIAYAALKHVREFFGTSDAFQFLCPDGSVVPLATERPCAWIKQPWGIIAARRDRAAALTKDLKSWLVTPFASESWSKSLSEVLQGDATAVALAENMSLGSYLMKGRTEVDFPNTLTCGKPIRWCTISDKETKKCEWTAKETLALGIEPRIECVQASSTFQCFRDISQNSSDIVTIDSNYGHLARQVYNLGTVLYCENENNKNSVVVAVVREPEKDDYAVNSFHNLKGRKACFPEYGGIAWLSFVKTVRTNGVLTSKSCNYPKHVSKLLSGACTPGIGDNDHMNYSIPAHELTPAVTKVLCSVCPTEDGNNTCSANESNKYFGDKGALQCLSDGAGDIAFIEARNLLEDGTIDPNRYRILCKNSSLASSTGFHFDELCALSVTIDSEVISRRNNTQIDTLDMTLALMKIENWLGYRAHAQRPIRIYDQFDGTKDLLFKDSTSGLVTTQATIRTVLAYKELFSHVEQCSSGVLSAISNLGLVVLLSLFSFNYFRVL